MWNILADMHEDYKWFLQFEKNYLHNFDLKRQNR